MNTPQKKILLAEDEGLLRSMLHMVFSDEDYQTDIVADGNEAWELLEENDYDLLATDMVMPNMNGIELILKCQASHPTTKTILLSGGGTELTGEHRDQHIKYNDQELDIDMLLIKPCDLDELLSVIKMLLRA
ncbi:MAG: response regulator [Gammaproteobacteria bacterium]|nr:response regulator [Gammaproteobacteria bacterium]